MSRGAQGEGNRGWESVSAREGIGDLESVEGIGAKGLADSIDCGESGDDVEVDALGGRLLDEKLDGLLTDHWVTGNSVDGGTFLLGGLNELAGDLLVELGKGAGAFVEVIKALPVEVPQERLAFGSGEGDYGGVAAGAQENGISGAKGGNCGCCQIGEGAWSESDDEDGRSSVIRLE